jgi:DNA-binding LytR/AlgR family response regulator
MEARLPRDSFIRIHRSFIVSVGKISAYSSDTISLGKYEVPISRSYREAVMKRLGGG